MKDQRLFHWQAINTQGELLEGELLSTNRQQAQKALIMQGLQPLRLKGGKAINLRQWQSETLLLFTRQLATLLHAGLPLVNSLQLLSQESPKPIWRCLLHDISEQVALGQPLSEVIIKYPGLFPSLYQQMIAIGELTGNLDSCCQQLAQQLEQQQQLKNKVMKALRYPLFVLLAAAIVTILMLVIVLPEFAKIYATFNAPLPLFTEVLLSLSHLLMQTGHYFTLIIIAITVIYLRYFHPQKKWQQREQQLLLTMPIINKLIKGRSLSLIFRTLAMTQQAGLTLLEGLNAAALSSNNLLYQQAVIAIGQQIAQGHTFHQTIKQQPLFPTLCQQLIRVGEESGTLDILLIKLANWHEQQTNALADTLAQTLEPMLMLIMGGVVGALVIAMYLPIFKLGNVLA